MRKYILSTILVAMILSACKKDATIKVSQKTKAVTFNVGFEQATGVFQVAQKSGKLAINSVSTNAVDSVLKANADVLYAVVYQSDGTRFANVTQLSTDTAFGKIKFNLPAGTYTVAFAAGKSGLSFSGSSSSKVSTEVLVYATPIPGRPGFYDNHFQDTFFDKITLTVGSNGFSQSVSLHRIVSQIIVNIEDAIPQNVKFIGLTASDNFYNNSVSSIPDFRVGTETTEGNDGLFVVFAPSVTPGVKNTKFSFLVLNARPFNIRLLAVNTLQPGNASNNNLNTYLGDAVADVTIPGVAVQTNHQTIVTGKIFGGLGTTNSGNFTITVDPTWDPTPNTIPFQ